MKHAREQLSSYLKGTLQELNKLSDQIRLTRDYTEQAELVLCLQELILEQIDENSRPPAHTVR